LIAGADLLVSGDSGLLHIGVALGVPTVSLFGPGIAEKWAPRGEQHCVLNLQLPCSPCTLFGTTPPCEKQLACLSGVSVDTVFNAVKKQLQQNGIT
jgi:ADP-heptose:LPS heptosyltransferase